MASGRHAHWLAGAALITVVLTVYLNALPNEFVWDDQSLIVRNPHVQSLRHLPKLFNSHLFEAAGSPSLSYRPLQALTYAIDHAIWGLRPFGYHLTNILLHALCTLMVYALLNLLHANKRTAFVAALIFGVHPVHTEAVTYVSGRADPLMGLFFLAAFSCFVLLRQQRCRHRALCLTGLGVGFCLAVFSKEYGLVLAPAMLLYDFTHRPNRQPAPRPHIVHPYLVVGAVLALYLCARGQVKFPTREMALSSAALPALVSRLLTFPKSLVEYVGLLVAPVRLHMQRVAPPVERFDQAAVLAPLILTALFVWGIARTYRTRKDVAFWLAWFLLMLLPVSDTFVPLNASMAEHWLYIPCIGFIAAGAIFVSKLSARGGAVRRGLVTAACGCAVLLLGARTIARNRDWRDTVSIWSHTARYADTSHIHGNLAVLYWDRGETDRAESELKRAIALQQNYPEAHYNLGRIHMSRGEWWRAEQEFRKALLYRPTYRNARICLERIEGKGVRDSERQHE